jgi:hypothetical protein
MICAIDGDFEGKGAESVEKDQFEFTQEDAEPGAPRHLDEHE